MLIFLLAFLPRAVYPVSRSDLWYIRAIQFSDALLAGDWEKTYLSYHPGVATMWLSGLGLKLFAWNRGLSSDQLLGVDPVQPGVVADAFAAGVLPLAFVIALCIAMSYHSLSRIAGRKVAFVGCLLLALDPFHITYSKVLHVDGLLATFMFTSALFLLSYLHGARWLDLILSGVCAGLAFLSKSPSLFLIPYAGLVVVANRLATPKPDPGASMTWSGRARQLWSLVRPLLIWGGVAVVVFVALWPAVWVDPLNAVGSIVKMVDRHVETLHPNPIYFDGKITFEDPGLPFYLATIVWRTTPVTLTMACVALLLALARFRRDGSNRIVWLLAAYVVFFTLQMGLAGWKEMRYVLPVFPMLDVLAAFGLVRLVEMLGRAGWWREKRWPSTAFIALALALQALFSLSRHPYYGTHYNAMLGGPGVAQRVLPLQDQCEGLDLAARYLNALPRAQRARVVVHPYCAGFFDRTFVGHTGVAQDFWASYRLYYANQVMRQLHVEEWGEAWNADREGEPLWTATFDGITYVWVYGSPPEEPAAGGPEYEVNIRLGEHITLRRVRLSSDTAAPGDKLVVVPIWESDGEIRENYMVFCHVLSEDGDLVTQRDGPPIYGARPTPSWRPGEVIEDSYDLSLPGDLAAGEYEVSIGMYDLESMERVPAYDANGDRLAEDRIVLGPLRIRAPGASD